ncbi:SDR family oxidoreductase [Hydrogenophaga sp.]|uniref:SDR family NAD(P)-dependent oxidoreductase n=1 Tax=Hydrogenophaga sp. TaxID=1904254 RepID=UPI00271B04CA|nr:SDR family oxidoreductase [Hydrogenophaga sp.]MDO9435324.1 SDR family oxidoreductase [Hydrogenophaga sp.]
MAHCFVTGGTRGIGAATALLAAQRGHDLTLVARDAEGPHVPPLLDAIRACGRQVQVLTADIAQESDVVQAFVDAERGLAPVRALVNAAGMGHNARVEALDAAIRSPPSRR